MTNKPYWEKDYTYCEICGARNDQAHYSYCTKSNSWISLIFRAFAKVRKSWNII